MSEYCENCRILQATITELEKQVAALLKDSPIQGKAALGIETPVKKLERQAEIDAHYGFVDQPQEKTDAST